MTTRLLHVDHDGSVLELSRRYLRDEGGLFLDTATNGTEGLEKVRGNEYEVVVAELQLSDMDFGEFARKVREILPEVCFVLFVSRDRAESAMNSLNDGADFCLLKNSAPDMHFPQLLDLVKRAARERAAAKASKDKLERCLRLAESLPDVAYLYKLPDKGFEFMSPAVEHLLGFSPEEFHKRPNLAFELTHPEDEARFSELWTRPETQKRSLMVRLRHKNGMMRWVEVNQAPVMDEMGSVVAVSGTVRDVTERESSRLRYERVEALRKMHNRVNRVMLRSGDRETLFEDACHAIAESGGFRTAWIGIADGNDRGIRMVASCGIRGEANGDPGDSASASTEIRGAPLASVKDDRVIVTNDVRSDESAITYGNDGSSRDYKSSASLPIRQGGRPIGSLNLYSPDPGFFDDNTVETLIPVADDIGYALDRISQEDRRRAIVDKLASHYYLLDVISDAVIVTDPEFVITSWNKGAEKVYGWRADEAVGRKSYELLRTEFVTSSRSEVIRGLNETGQFIGEMHQRTKDGTRIVVQISLFAVRDDTGTIKGYVGVNRDVTKERHAFDQIRKQERFMMDVFSSIRDGVCVLDRDFTIVRVNSTIERWYEHSLPLVGGSCHAAYFFRDSPCDGCPSLEALRTGRTVVRCMPRMGSANTIEGWMDVHAFPMLNHETGETVGIIEYMRDVTESKRAEESLRVSEERHRNIVELASEGIWAVDAEGVTTLANPKMAEMLGYAAEEMIGRPLYSFMTDEEAHFVREFFQGSLDLDVGSREAGLIRKDGSKVLASVSARLVRDPAGKLTGAIAVLTDVTERRFLEAQLRRVNEKLALMGSATRHDALNQVGVLAGWLEMAIEESRDESISSYLSNMKRAMDNLRDLLEFTRDYQNMGESQPEWLDVRQAIVRGASGLDLKGVTLEIRFEDLQLFSDPMLEKVFRNIIDNSVRHGSGVRSIVIEAGKRGGDLVLSVQDDGQGVPENEKRRIFERGYGKHTGLGLYLVQEILAITGITISETGPPGKGARFEILIPGGKFRIVESQSRKKEKKAQ